MFATNVKMSQVKEFETCVNYAEFCCRMVNLIVRVETRRSPSSEFLFYCSTVTTPLSWVLPSVTLARLPSWLVAIV